MVVVFVQSPIGPDKSGHAATQICIQYPVSSIQYSVFSKPISGGSVFGEAKPMVGGVVHTTIGLLRKHAATQSMGECTATPTTGDRENLLSGWVCNMAFGRL